MPSRPATHGINRLQPIEWFEFERNYTPQGKSPIPRGRRYEVMTNWMQGLSFRDGSYAMNLSWDEMRENGRILDIDGNELDFDDFDKNPPKKCNNAECKCARALRLESERLEAQMTNPTRFDRINGETPKPATDSKPPRSKKGAKPRATSGWSEAVADGRFGRMLRGSDQVPMPVPDTRTLWEKIEAGVYDASKVMPWPGHKPRDPEVMAAKKRYQEIQARLSEQFKQDLFQEEGVPNNPKRDLCFEKAWDLGHSAGLHEVQMYFSDLAELIK